MYKIYIYFLFIIKIIKIMVNVNIILFSKLRCIFVKKKIVLVCFLKEYMLFEMKFLEERNVCVL